MRFIVAAISAGAAWWAIGTTIVPDLFLRRSPISLLIAILTSWLTARLSRPFYLRSAGHLLWLTPASVYFAAAMFGYLLPLVTEHVNVLERCLEMVQALWKGATFSIFGFLVFPAAFATHWILRRLAIVDATVATQVAVER